MPPHWVRRLSGARPLEQDDLHSDVTLKNMPGPPIIEVKEVGCSKAKGQPIFSNVSFTVNEGDVVMLQGKSGSG